VEVVVEGWLLRSGGGGGGHGGGVGKGDVDRDAYNIIGSY